MARALGAGVAAGAAEAGDRIVDGVLVFRRRTTRADQAGADDGARAGRHLLATGTDWFRRGIAAREKRNSDAWRERALQRPKRH